MRRRQKKPDKKNLGPLQLVEIEAVAFGGDGIARHNGKVIFVPDSLPGEELMIALSEEKTRFARASVRERLKASPFAGPSPCPYSERCGACQWLGVAYEKQLAWKEDFIRSALQRIGKLELPGSLYIHASPDHSSYRNRIKLKLLQRRDGRLIPGYFAKGSHDLVAIESCWIAAPALNRALKSLAALTLAAPARESIYEIALQELAHPPHLVTLTLIGDYPRTFELELRKALEHGPDPLLVASQASDAPRLLEQPPEDLRYLTFPGQFQQVNLAANQLLRRRVRELIQSRGARRVLDLYCGSGNLSLQLIRENIAVWGLEVSAAAMACAQANLSSNELKKGHYVRGTAEQLALLFPSLQVDALIVDPPRKGLTEAIPQILALQVPYIIYVSCDPNTLARDLKQFVAAGYRLETCEGFDFFPQTYHIETLVTLVQEFEKIIG